MPPPDMERGRPRQESGLPEMTSDGFSAVISLPRSANTRRLTLRALLRSIDVAEEVRRQSVREAIRDALAETWLRRADLFEAARPRPGDFTGQATAADLAEADRRCRETAAACRGHARLLAEADAEEEVAAA